MSKNVQMILRSNMRFIGIFLLTITFFMNSALAVQEDKIISTMNQKIDEVIMVLQNKSFTQDVKAKSIFNLMDDMFDFNVMSRISLGRSWKNLDTQQQNNFSEKFEARLKASYVDKMKLYTNQQIKIIRQEKVKKNRIKLITHVIGSDETYVINYKFYKNKTSEWLIYDVEILGVSILQTYRKQFIAFLKNKSFDELLKTL